MSEDVGIAVVLIPASAENPELAYVSVRSELIPMLIADAKIQHPQSPADHRERWQLIRDEIIDSKIITSYSGAITAGRRFPECSDELMMMTRPVQISGVGDNWRRNDSKMSAPTPAGGVRRISKLNNRREQM